MCFKFKVSNDSHFDLVKIFSVQFRLHRFYDARICLELVKYNHIERNSKSKLTLCLSCPPNFAPDQISVNMRLLSPVFVFNENID